MQSLLFYIPMRLWQEYLQSYQASIFIFWSLDETNLFLSEMEKDLMMHCHIFWLYHNCSSLCSTLHSILSFLSCCWKLLMLSSTIFYNNEIIHETAVITGFKIRNKLDLLPQSLLHLWNCQKRIFKWPKNMSR